MTIDEFMTTKVVTVEADDPLAAIRNLFSRGNFHHLPVVDEGRLVGMISDRDLKQAISPALGTLAETEKDRATLNKRAHQIMTRRPYSLAPKADLRDAIALLNRHRISCIPVVDEQQCPVGILTWRDILHVLETRGFTLNKP